METPSSPGTALARADAPVTSGLKRFQRRNRRRAAEIRDWWLADAPGPARLLFCTFHKISDYNYNTGVYEVVKTPIPVSRLGMIPRLPLYFFGAIGAAILSPYWLIFGND